MLASSSRGLKQGSQIISSLHILKHANAKLFSYSAHQQIIQLSRSLQTLPSFFPSLAVPPSRSGRRARQKVGMRRSGTDDWHIRLSERAPSTSDSISSKSINLKESVRRRTTALVLVKPEIDRRGKEKRKEIQGRHAFDNRASSVGKI